MVWVQDGPWPSRVTVIVLLPSFICSLVTSLGFHTYCYTRPHFLASCTHTFPFPTIPNGVEFEGRLAHVARAFPIGINSFTSPPPTTTTTPPPPSTKREKFHVHTILPARNVDVWKVALRSFRDTIILPIATALNARLSVLNQELEGLPESHTYPRLHQLLLVLVSQGRQPTTASLTALAPSQGELAVPHQLKVVRSDAPSMRAAAQRWGSYAAGTHSFFSGNVPHNRRGRISHKPGLDEPGSDFEDDALTPRLTTTITAPRRAELQWWRRVAVTTIAEAVDGGLHGGAG
ncbi:hypothetical protein EDB89DRAFT_382091 [Lactarius sanguifluus]|nr:hypothetical protein EDB89DRAFT_382091 [Lactarius sanguifluus]